MKHITLLLILLAIGFGSVLVIGPRPKQVPADSQTRYTIDPNVSGSNSTAQHNLQLRSIPFITVTIAPTAPVSTVAPVTPTPTSPIVDNSTSCTHESGVPIGTCSCNDTILQCNNKQCVTAGILGKPNLYGCNASTEAKCQDYGHTGTASFCIGKPVIYLYPQVKTLVDVKVSSIGKIVISDPLYPPDGWHNVEAYPDGSLVYDGRKYRELFYETNVTEINTPSNGRILKSSELAAELTKITTALGLTSVEQTEFLEWWVPRLTATKSPYILFSLIESHEKERIDTVHITPQPDTFISFIAYFKPLSKPYFVTPLILPSTPKRVGFTAVEWGGVLDTNNTFTLY